HPHRGARHRRRIGRLTEGGECMGSNSSQGWYLFIFIVGFTLGPAGVFALGWLVAVVGFALLLVSFVGFRSIQEGATNGRTRIEEEHKPALEAQAAKSF